MISLRNVSKSFKGRAAVDNISFTVQEGETFILLGTSGCGKTTTLRMINRLTEPSRGEIYVNGQPAKTQRAEQLRRNMGYVLQQTGLFPHYTVAENIAVVARLLNWNERRIRERTAVLMNKLHLPPEYLHAYPEKLSGGQQQRVGLARALMTDPPVLLMDEPFGALDPVTRASIRHEFKHLDELKRKTIIMVTHDVQEAFELGHRICLMHAGRVMQIGTPAELLFEPHNKFVSNFLNEQQLLLKLKSVKITDSELFNDKIKTGTNLWEAMELLTAGGGNVEYTDLARLLRLLNQGNKN